MAYKALKDSQPYQMVTIPYAGKHSPLNEYCIRRLIREGKLPTKTIKTGNRILLNLDLLIKNLNKEN